MKILLDQNLSHRLKDVLKDEFDDIIHVKDAGLSQADDRTVWEYAKENHLIIVTKDADFWERTVLQGHPPKVIWVKRGNCPTKTIGKILKDNVQTIQRFALHSQLSILTLY